jgi:hypothetical protein
MTPRGVGWVPLLSGCALASAILAGCVVAKDGGPPLTLVRVALIALAAGTAPILDDPAAPVVEAVPVTRRRRTMSRMAVVVAPLSVWVAGVLALELRSVTTPAAALLVEGAGALAATVAVSATLRFAGRDEPGDVAATVVCTALLGLLVFPPSSSVTLFPVERGWATSSILWAGLAVVAVAVVLLTSGDVRRRRPVVGSSMAIGPGRSRGRQPSAPTSGRAAR